METFKGKIQDFKLSTSQNSVVVVGYFDGLHHYHQELLRQASEIAQKNNLKLIVVTFSKKIGTSNQTADLMSEKTKKDFLVQNYQIDDYLILTVDDYLISLSPQDFVNWLKKGLKTVKMVEGADFRFGHFAKGNVATLQKTFGEENVTILPRQNKVSSTIIREQLQNGKIDEALENLGHDLTIDISTQENGNLIKYSWVAPNIVFPPNKYQLETSNGQKVILDYHSPTNFSFQPERLDSEILYLKKQK
ncbi:riboflavin kinase/FMN adenylyltransferase [Entomoplasma freundtii]|uniref:FAD synthase n=1 Tax=Entomoplasma freundtii TaxID=74700 RepID=A0A2K8NRJ4_9MOLU|nr:FAD synthetase family protein [Entomoplasma freundtii]ATZ16475.1 bifunctional riboflavin kinase/FMN adenylyltransferase [Entomoplasma freundtii]TDY56004.1 riboflavin kinase/FMN adenylyltransferase [Entomoplasma freundtii]